ncbi:DUF1254 domain-containing protein [Pseudomonas jinjuensis]|uniref:Uncharacterized conserved protein n=1 Tax=Pseudomonas jinjuensis TaxID=198616 RepID=A0A1G9YN27_9PSED|nr:DUF1214 domain-containing protein [Pseudomonas jinjuensis]SDN10599.1 Uncharacterized conserved protein [Pseudomonas jinjuensis]
MTRTKLALALGLGLSLLVPTYAPALAADARTASAMSAEQAREEYAYALGIQAYAWGYPLVRYDMGGLRSIKAGVVNLNSFRKHTELKTARDRTVVTPNNVTIDAYARLDLRSEPFVLHVPQLPEKRWSLIQVGNMLDEVTANIGGNAGPQPGDYLIVAPGFRGVVPAGMQLIQSRTNFAIVAARINAPTSAEIPLAVEAQKGFQLMPLSAYQREGLAYKAPKAELPADYVSAAPENVRFFDYLGQAMQKFLPATGDRDQSLIDSFGTIGLSIARGFDWRSLDAATLRGLARAAQAGEQIVAQRWQNPGEVTNGWRYFMLGGRAGYDFPLRATLTRNVIGAQNAEQVYYPNTEIDDQGDPLSGRHRYVLRFAKGEQPPAAVFWNLSLYGPDMYFVENDFRRYSIGSTTDGLKTDADGSITLVIQHERPADTANWLPAPEGPFNLTMRFYGPEPAVLDGRYRLPAVQRVN